ncbi:MAG: GntR family transcriptional regulator, partial [Anaerorhabdus sp.]
MDYIKINKFSSIPLYIQLKESIKNAILVGRLKQGDQIPTEADVCNIFGLSRTVTRQAYYDLMAEGYIVRYKSRGTFVKNADISTGFFKEIKSFNEEMRRAGYNPRTVVLSKGEEVASEEIAKLLEINAGDPYLRVKRLRFRNDVPVVYVDAFIKKDKLTGLLDFDLENNSLYETMEKEFGIKICRTCKTF